MVEEDDEVEDDKEYRCDGEDVSFPPYIPGVLLFFDVHVKSASSRV